MHAGVYMKGSMNMSYDSSNLTTPVRLLAGLLRMLCCRVVCR